MCKFRRGLRVATLLLGLSSLTMGCASTKLPTPTTETLPARFFICGAWPLINYSAKGDTPETVRQVIEANARRKAACG